LSIRLVLSNFPDSAPFSRSRVLEDHCHLSQNLN
jgi:hypothetical protein